MDDGWYDVIVLSVETRDRSVTVVKSQSRLTEGWMDGRISDEGQLLTSVSSLDRVVMRASKSEAQRRKIERKRRRPKRAKGRKIKYSKNEGAETGKSCASAEDELRVV